MCSARPLASSSRWPCTRVVASPKPGTTLAAAVLSHDWRPSRVRDQDDWIVHSLRREAEALIVPDLPAFLAGKLQPRDNDERLAMLADCQFKGLWLTGARLFVQTHSRPIPASSRT